MRGETMTLDLDEIARRRLIGDMARPEHVLLTAAERDALVAAARGFQPLWENEATAHTPEMPADVAGISVIVSKDALADAVLNAHTLIEALERQRQEAVDLAGALKWERDAAVASLSDDREAWSRTDQAVARAEQAEKELADERGKLNTVRRCLADREEIAQKDAARLAKLEAVVAAITKIRERYRDEQWHMDAMQARGDLTKDYGEHSLRTTQRIVRELDDALAALEGGMRG